MFPDERILKSGEFFPSSPEAEGEEYNLEQNTENTKTSTDSTNLNAAFDSKS